MTHLILVTNILNIALHTVKRLSYSYPCSARYQCKWSTAAAHFSCFTSHQRFLRPLAYAQFTYIYIRYCGCERTIFHRRTTQMYRTIRTRCACVSVDVCMDIEIDLLRLRFVRRRCMNLYCSVRFRKEKTTKRIHVRPTHPHILSLTPILNGSGLLLVSCTLLLARIHSATVGCLCTTKYEHYESSRDIFRLILILFSRFFLTCCSSSSMISNGTYCPTVDAVHDDATMRRCDDDDDDDDTHSRFRCCFTLLPYITWLGMDLSWALAFAWPIQFDSLRMSFPEIQK